MAEDTKMEVSEVTRNEFLSDGAADYAFALASNGTVVTEESEALLQSEAQTTHWIEEDRL